MDASDVYSRLPVKYAQDYEILKDALLKGLIWLKKVSNKNSDHLDQRRVKHQLSSLRDWKII